MAFVKSFWQKNYKKIIPVLVLILLVLGGHFVFERKEQPNKESQSQKSAAEAEKSDGLSLKEQTSLPNPLQEKVGQMLIIGFRGTSWQDNSFIAKALNDLKIGGIILFDYDAPSAMFPRNIVNPNQTKQLIGNLQKHSSVPLFISIDVEGGYVNRLKSKYGFIDIPSAAKMGQGAPEQTLQIAKNLGQELSNLGINFDFAPVVDLNINPQNPVIGKLGRSFGENTQVVISHAENFINGLTQSNIITSIKHFPGHGSSQTDSHQGITDITNTYQAEELVPFQELVKKNIAPTIMVAHTFNKNLDEKYPASLSQNTIQKTLKELLNFQGVVVCDDLSMGAISQNYGLKEAAVKMVQAGCDLIIISNNVGIYDETLPYQVSNAILQSASLGEIPTSSIEASYNKIMDLKKEFGIIE